MLPIEVHDLIRDTQDELAAERQHVKDLQKDLALIHQSWDAERQRADKAEAEARMYEARAAEYWEDVHMNAEECEALRAEVERLKSEIKGIEGLSGRFGPLGWYGDE